MKQLFEKRSRKMAIFGLLIFAFIGLLMLVSGGIFAGTLGIAIATVVPLSVEEDAFIQKVKSEVNAEIEKYKKDYISEAKINEILNQKFADFSKNLANEAQISELKKAFEDLGVKVKGLETKGEKTSKFDSFVENLTKAAKSLTDKITSGEREKGFSTVGEIGFKQVGNMAESTNLTGEVVLPDRKTGINEILRQRFFIKENANTYSTNSNLVEWVEEHDEEGTADNTAEGSAKSQIDTNFRLANMAIKKITAYVKITTEMLSDIPAMLNFIQSKLIYKIEKQVETQLLSGTGLTKYLKGITQYAQTLDLAALADTVKVPNNADVLRAAITQIYTNTLGSAMPNLIALSPVDYFEMVSEKDGENNYVFPGWMLPNGMRIDDVRIIKSISIPAGYYLCADMSKFNVPIRENNKISIGLDGNDFTTNFVTILAETRLASYVMSNDVEAFIYDTFANGKAFLNQS